MIQKYIFTLLFLIQKKFDFNLMQKIDSGLEKLSQLLGKLILNEGFKKFVKKTIQKLNFQKNNILNLTPEKVENLYLALNNKLKSSNTSTKDQKSLQNSIWFQNQLRTFIYILCAHLYFQKITIHQLRLEDLVYLNIFFPNKKVQHLQYQIKLLLNNKNIKWTVQESRLFEQIMRQNKDSKKWNYIAKQLFMQSSKRFFKTPKQCRERWINHVDPMKLKGKWSKEEDTILFRSVLNYGKKWTLISHQLNDTRTQNNVKNRFNSLIKAGKKQYGFDQSQQRLIENLYQSINNQQQKQKFLYESKLSSKIQIEIQGKLQKKIQNYIQYQKKYKSQSIHVIQIKKTKGKKFKVTNQLQEEKIIQQNNVNEQFDYNFKQILNESEEIQNIAWNSSQSVENIDIDFYLKNDWERIGQGDC